MCWSWVRWTKHSPFCFLPINRDIKPGQKAWRSCLMTLRSKQQQMDWERIPEFKVLPKCRQLYFFFFFSSVTAPFHLEDSRRIQDSKRREWRSVWGGRKRERKRENVHARRRESPRESALAPPFMFFLPPGPALCKLGLARSAVCSAWSFHSGPRTFLWPSLSFSHRHFGLLFPILPT